MSKMPTAQSSTSSSQQASKSNKQNKGAKSMPEANFNVDNNLAKAAAKIAISSTCRNSSQENTRATTPDQQNIQIMQQGENKTPQEQPEFIKQALITIEKKVRNLEKRRIKLEEYRENQAKGETLNDDQLIAISRYDEVLRTLELSRELEKQFIQLANDAMKQQKKQLKKEQIEREEAIKEKLKESNKIITLLNTFINQSVRNDFTNEVNGATKLNEHEIIALEQFGKLVLPLNHISQQLDVTSLDSAEHMFNLIEGKNKQIGALNAQVIGASFTYADLKKLIERIFNSIYWKKREEIAQIASDQIETKEETHESGESAQTIDSIHSNDQINTQNTNVDDQFDQKQQIPDDTHSNLPIEQAVYQQQNTSEDYILVSSTEYNGENSQSRTAGASSKTFFSTLNSNDSVNRNINEFLNRCENSDDGINFLQDSEIQPEIQQRDPQSYKHTSQADTDQHLQNIDESNQNHQERSDHYQMSQSQSYGNYQDLPSNQESNKDNRGARSQREHYNGPRNNAQNNFQRPRYQDDPRGTRRSGGGNNQSNGMTINHQQTRNNGNERNGGSSSFRGNRGPGVSAHRSIGTGYPSGTRPNTGAGNGGGQRYTPRNPENRQVLQN